eukprot:c13401_g1_i3 orf=3-200(-)
MKYIGGGHWSGRQEEPESDQAKQCETAGCISSTDRIFRVKDELRYPHLPQIFQLKNQFTPHTVPPP